MKKNGLFFILSIIAASVFAQQSSWLNSTKAVNPAAEFIDSFLNKLKGNIHFRLCNYDHTALVSAIPFSGKSLRTPNSQWECSIQKSKVSEDNHSIEFAATFKVVNGHEKNAGVAISFNFSNWNINNYILVPAMIYGGNRFRILPIAYPPYIHNEADRPIDMPVTVTGIPHLNPDGSYARVELTTGNVATPLLSFFSPALKQGFILLTEQGTQWGNNGLFVEEDASHGSKEKRVAFTVSAPAVRKMRYAGCESVASTDKGADWKKGDSITLKFKLYSFKAADLTGFYAKVFDVRKALSGKNSYSNVTPYSAAANLILEHHNKNKWFDNGKYAYYCNRPGDNNPYSYQMGWNGPPIIAFPNLIAETPERIERVCSTYDNVLFKAQGKTGLFYAINRNGKLFGDVHGKQAERPTISMTRRSMDILYFGLKSFELLKKQGHSDKIKPEWEKSLRACADGLVKVWNTYGQFGQFIDVETGKMEINGSTAGSSIGAALSKASAYFKEPKYLQVAEAATKMYYERDFLKGYAGGGAAEILQSPDSEAPWDMAESCVLLYETTGKPEWLQRAKYATNMLATWMVSYDYRFPKGSAMEVAGTHAAGSIFASSQNNHSAPGYYILSGDFMLKLFRATGDKRYAEMYKDQSHNVVQYVGTPHNPLRRQSGYVTERVQLSDWEGKNEGSVSFEDSNMAWEILAALTCLENPGIYLHTDDETFLVMDHVEARVIKRDKSGVRIKITNPTAYDASVSVFAESKKESAKPLGSIAFLNWPKVQVKAGESVEIFVSTSKQITTISSKTSPFEEGSGNAY